jgi:hypothetical protein
MVPILPDLAVTIWYGGMAAWVLAVSLPGSGGAHRPNIVLP